MEFLVDILFYLGLMSMGFGLLGCVNWLFEHTKIGKKLDDKMYDYFMKK